MKKIISILLMCLICVPAFAEEAPVEEITGPVVYEYTEGDLYTVSPERIVEFDGLFTLKLPEKWQRYVVSEESLAEGAFVCFGDGEVFMDVAWAADEGLYADTEAYCLYMQEHGYENAFLTIFGGTEDVPGVEDDVATEGTDFVLYSDPEAGKAMCAVVIPGSGIYTFTFAIAEDMDAGQEILDLMESYEPMEAADEPAEVEAEIDKTENEPEATEEPAGDAE